MENLDALNRAGRHVSIRTMLRKEGFWLVFVGILLAISGLFLFNLFGLFLLIFGILILIFGIKMQRTANINYMWAISTTLLMLGVSNFILTNSGSNASLAWLYIGIILSISVMIRYFRIRSAQAGEYNESDAKKVQDIIDEIDQANPKKDDRFIKFFNNQSFGAQNFKGLMDDGYMTMKGTKGAVYFCDKNSIVIEKISKRPMQNIFNLRFSTPDRKFQAIIDHKYLERFKNWIGIKPEKTEPINVNDFKVASRNVRFLNYIIDGITIILITFVIWFLYIAIIVLVDPSQGKNTGGLVGAFFVIIILVKFFYYYILDRRGKTLAKYVSKSRTVSKNGYTISAHQAITRSLVRFIPFEPFSLLPAHSKGWHDSIAGTLVVRDRDFKPF